MTLLSNSDSYISVFLCHLKSETFLLLYNRAIILPSSNNTKQKAWKKMWSKI